MMMTPLTSAAQAGNIIGLQLLLDAGAQVNAPDCNPGLGYTALHHAAMQGKVDVVQLLLEKGANSQNCSKHGLTVVQVANFCCDNDTKEKIMYILENSDRN